jgi:F0F1-type ATP synthase membrane subunit b/b'
MSTTLLLLLLAEGDPPWWDYPGFELWKFLNLGIFTVLAIIVLRYVGVPEKLRARKLAIGKALVKAQQERDAALKQLAEVEERLLGLDAEVAAIRERARIEAEAESDRLRRATDAELAKLRESAQREVTAASKNAAAELRRFASSESVRQAEQIILSEINESDDERLLKVRTASLGGPTH